MTLLPRLLQSSHDTGSCQHVVRKTHVVYTLVLLRFRKRPRACTCLSTEHSSAHRPWGSPSDEASVTQGSCTLLASLLVCTPKGPFAMKVGEWDECTRRATSALSPRPGHGSRFSLSICSCTPRSVQHCRKFYLIMGQLCEWSWGCVAGPPILSHSCHSHPPPLPGGQVLVGLAPSAGMLLVPSDMPTM